MHYFNPNVTESRDGAATHDRRENTLTSWPWRLTSILLAMHRLKWGQKCLHKVWSHGRRFFIVIAHFLVWALRGFVILTFDILTSKFVGEIGVTWATFASSLGFLELSWVGNRHGTDGETDEQQVHWPKKNPGTETEPRYSNIIHIHVMLSASIRTGKKFAITEVLESCPLMKIRVFLSVAAAVHFNFVACLLCY